MVDSALLQKLRAKKAASGPVAEAPKTSVTPEPQLPKADVSGLDTPIPAGMAPINPPDAAANVSPEDPPMPPAPAAEAKPKRGAKAKAVADSEPASPATTYGRPPYDSPGFIPAPGSISNAEAVEFLKRLGAQALNTGNFVRAGTVAQLLLIIDQHG